MNFKERIHMHWWKAMMEAQAKADQSSDSETESDSDSEDSDSAEKLKFSYQEFLDHMKSTGLDQKSEQWSIEAVNYIKRRHSL